jgi:S1-C subfamily serine protease
MNQTGITRGSYREGPCRLKRYQARWLSVIVIVLELSHIMDGVSLIKSTRTGVARVIFERDRERVSNGSAFLVGNGLLTNSHVIRGSDYDAVAIYFEDAIQDPGIHPIRLSRETIDESVVVESVAGDKDYALLRLEEPEFANRHTFELGSDSDVEIGEQVVFLGFPFGMAQLTCHMGYVSSKHELDGVRVLQIDGSVNGGNSGGPLLDLKTGRVIGIITRAVTGYIAEQFNELIRALGKNIEFLNGIGEVMQVGAFRATEIALATQVTMRKIAKNLRRSANVEIGYAYSVDYVKDRIGDS